MPKSDDVTLKSTKADLFKAYQEMKENFDNAKKEQLPLPQQEAQKKEEDKIVEKTATFVPETAENEIISLRKKIHSNLEEVKDQLIQESGKLQDVRKAVKIEKQRLQEVYNIELANDALQTLIADYSSKEKELELRRQNEESALNEEMNNRRKNWEREQEEYKYNLKIERKKEENEYEMAQAKKQAEWQENINRKEEELNEREDSLNKRTEDIEQMKQKIEAFPDKLEGAVHSAVKGKEHSLRKEFDTEKQIKDQKYSSEKEMLESRIGSLQETIKNQTDEVVSLKKALAESNQRAQDLATTMVENASAGLRQQQVKQMDSEKSEKKSE